MKVKNTVDKNGILSLDNQNQTHSPLLFFFRYDQFSFLGLYPDLNVFSLHFNFMELNNATSIFPETHAQLIVPGPQVPLQHYFSFVQFHFGNPPVLQNGVDRYEF